MSTNKAAILKAVGANNEAQATKLLADLDMSLGERVIQRSVLLSTQQHSWVIVLVLC